MIKRILIVMLVFAFALSGTSFAGSVELSDNAMDGINAGSWVIVKDSEGNDQVVDVYTTNNTLWLLENSQKDIQAISNANAIDSAVAVQTNVARVTGDTPTDNVTVTGANSAELVNYRPALATSASTKTTNLSTTANTSGSSKEVSMQSSTNTADVELSSASSSASSGAAMLYDETLDVTGSLAGSSKDIGKYGITGGSTAGSLVVDYDKHESGSSSAASASAEQSSKNLQSTALTALSCKSTETQSSTATTEVTTEIANSSRESKGANNHILLDATSQQSIHAISNLNAVASGAAVQNNIASNVGVSGAIAQSNSASVQSGF